MLSVGILSIAVIMLASAVALIAQHAPHGDVRAAQGDRDHAAGGGDQLADPRPVPDRGLVESLLGRGCGRSFALFLVKVIFIDRLRDEIQFFPLVQNHDVLAIAPWILIARPP